MIRIFFLLVSLVMVQESLAQTCGEVYDARSRRGLEGVNIYLFKDTIGVAVTDKHGLFDLQLLRHCVDSDTIVFSHVGYELQKMTVKALKDCRYQVSLVEHSQQLGQVTVTAPERHYYLSYEKVTDMPKSLFAFASCLVRGKLFVVAGDGTSIVAQLSVNDADEADVTAYVEEFRSPYIYVYDLTTDTWETKSCRVTERAGHVVTLYNNRLFIVGGVRYSTNRRLEYTDEKLEIYDLAKDTLYVDPVNPHQGLNMTSVVYDDLFYLIGGSKKQHLCWEKMHALDLKRGYWYEMGDIPKEYRREANGILVGHTVYFFGGSRNGLPSKDIYSCDLLSGEWRQCGELDEAVIFPALAVQGDNVFVYEGNSLQMYHCRTNSLNSYPLFLGLNRAALHCWKGELYVVGGYLCDEDYSQLPSSEIYRVDVGWLLRE